MKPGARGMTKNSVMPILPSFSCCDYLHLQLDLRHADEEQCKDQYSARQPGYAKHAPLVSSPFSPSAFLTLSTDLRLTATRHLVQLRLLPPIPSAVARLPIVKRAHSGPRTGTETISSSGAGFIPVGGMF